jgi:death on curing protein
MISLTEVLYLHEQSILDFGGSNGVRDQGLLESAIDRPNATFAGEELYPTLYLKAAAILESIVKNHPFVDGNKRTGWASCAALMRFSGFKFTLTEEEAYDFVIRVASSHLELEDIALFIELNSKKI